MSEPSQQFQAHRELKHAIWANKYSPHATLLVICTCPILAEQIKKLVVDSKQFNECSVSPIKINDDSDIWPRNDEELELGKAALCWLFDTVRQARAKGKYGPFSWLDETQQNQMEHAFEHCRSDLRELLHPSSQLLEKKKDPPEGEPHGAHALCRLAILAALKARNTAQNQS